MARKKTAAELQAEIARAQERIDQLRKMEQEATKAERAKDAKDLLDAVREWARTSAEHSEQDDAHLAQWFREMAQRNRAKRDAVGGTQSQETREPSAGAEPHEMPPAGPSESERN